MPGEKARDRDDLNHSCGDEEHAVPCPRCAVARPRRQQNAEHRRRERIGRLADRDDQGDHARDIVRGEFDLRDQRRKRGRVADSRAEQHDAQEDHPT